MRRILLFLNPLRVNRSRASSAEVDRCMALLSADGGVVETRETLPGDASEEQARQVSTEGFDAIFACGGDGTVFHLLQGLAGTDAVLGVIPLGTGNVLAHNLGLPRDPVTALKAQLGAPAASIPLGEVVWGQTRRFFTFAAGVGMHAAMMGLAPNGALKRRLGRAAYFASGAGLLLSRPVQPFEVELTGVDGATECLHASELICARVEWINRWRAGGDLRSSHLRAAFVPETNRLGLAHAFARALVSDRRGGDTRLPTARYMDAECVACRPVDEMASAVPLLVQADGEVIGEVGHAERVRFGIAREQIRMLVSGASPENKRGENAPVH